MDEQWMHSVSGDPLPWLLEDDPANPGVRYFALKDLLDFSPNAPEVVAAQKVVMASGPVPAILDHQFPEGYWVKPGAGYAPKYTGSVWSVIFLAQLGANGADPRVWAGCDYLLGHTRSSYGGFSITGAPSLMVHCLEGNLVAALIDLGWGEDPRLKEALEWMARSVTGDGIAPASDKQAPEHYFRSGNCAPGFACSGNGFLPCAWGAVKVALAFGKAPAGAKMRSSWLRIRLASISCSSAIRRSPITRWRVFPNPAGVGSSLAIPSVM